MRRRPGTRRAALLTGASALALAGLLVLLVQWIGLVAGTLRTGLADDGTCVAAATAGEGDAALSTSALPPRSVCTRTVDGRTERTVLAEGSAPLAVASAAAAGVGVVVVLGVAGSVLVARRRSAGERPGPAAGASRDG